MSDTYNTNSQSTDEVQKTVNEAIDAEINAGNGAYKPTWIEPIEHKVQTEEEEVEQPVEKSKVKTKKKAKTMVTKKSAKATKPAKTVGLDEFGFRKGSIRSKAAQLYASAKGATLDEVKKKCGSIQYNMLTELKKRGFKILSKEIEGKANRPASRYFLKSKKR